MKRTRLTSRAVALLAVLGLIACSDSDGLPDAPSASGSMIAFSGTALTRAEVTKSVTSDFGVSAYLCNRNTDGTYEETDVPVFYNQKVETPDNGTTWTYTPLCPWPSSDKLVRFFAWWPYDAPVDAEGNNTLSAMHTRPVSFSYTVPTDVASQQDLLYACTDPMNNAFDYTTDPANPAPKDAADKVKFTFSHALSQLSFKVQMADGVSSDYTASIRSLSVYAIGSGTMTLPAGSGDAAWTVERDFSEGASMSSLGIFTLTPGQGLPAANGSITDGNETVDTYNIAVQERSSGGLPAVAALHGTPLLLTGAGDFLFMVPQQPPVISLAKPTQLRTPVLNIRYRLDNGLQLQDKSGKTADDFGNPYTADYPSPDWLYTDKDVSLSLTDVHLTLQGKTEDDITGGDTDPWVWETGKSYCYVITISTADVTLNILPTDWIDGNNGETDYTFQ